MTRITSDAWNGRPSVSDPVAHTSTASPGDRTSISALRENFAWIVASPWTSTRSAGTPSTATVDVPDERLAAEPRTADRPADRARASQHHREAVVRPRRACRGAVAIDV